MDRSGRRSGPRGALDRQGKNHRFDRTYRRRARLNDMADKQTGLSRDYSEGLDFLLCRRLFIHFAIELILINDEALMPAARNEVDAIVSLHLKY